MKNESIDYNYNNLGGGEFFPLGHKCPCPPLLEDMDMLERITGTEEGYLSQFYESLRYFEWLKLCVGVLSAGLKTSI